MLTLRLSGEHAECLAEILETALSELRMEIAHTDGATFREGLQARKAKIEHVVRDLERLLDAVAH